jgi:flagellar hook-associated protein FlgK
MVNVKCNTECGKKIYVNPTSTNAVTKEFTKQVFFTHGVSSVENLIKIYRCKSCSKKGYKTKEDRLKVEEIPENSNGKLIGLQKYVQKINLLQKFGTKAIFIGGSHGLGKSSLVEELAEKNNAKLIRFQMTEMTSELDLIGSLDIRGGFIQSSFVKALIEASKNKEQNYYIMIDEFTRGRDEALNILFPLLAEKKLIINSPHSEVNEVVMTDNVKIFATGNLHDSGQREVGLAEFDRYNIVEIKPIMDIEVLNNIIASTAGKINSDTRDKLVKFYLVSWEKQAEARIIGMSIRTLIECSKIAKEINKTKSSIIAIKESLQLTYYGTSHAVLNPNYARTYQEMIREVV